MATSLASPPLPPTATEPALAPSPLAVQIAGLAHAYGSHQALGPLDLAIPTGEIFAVLGPNGGGKTSLFRVLSTLAPVQTGAVRVLGFDLARLPGEIQRRMGVVFQAPSLDRKLTVAENLNHQGALYGLAGRALAERRDRLLDRFGLADRASELTEKLSGGLRRRVELAKGLLHDPSLLLLDEPSTGLDPAARADLWRYLRALRDEQGTTILLTTHYLDEAEGADRLAILSAGQLVALGAPDELRAGVGGDSLTIETVGPASLAEQIRARFGLAAKVVDETVRIELPRGHEWIARLVEAFPGQITAIRLGQPTLEDVFIARTGHRFWRESEGN
ncbi:MAG: ATP-binding cassette domain-containing protein [Pirellulaceae bacterium]|nr:ATP-binding cassette domain-containing protein [Pirellulaceae bacterium]